MEPCSESATGWIESLESILLKLQDQRFLRLFNSESLISLDKALSAALVSIKIDRNARRPVNRLPLEIFSRIFQHVQQEVVLPFPGDVFKIDWPRFGRLVPRTRLMLVCRYWRDVILAFHSLWSTIVIQRGWPSHWHYEWDLAAYIERCLEHSGSTPLDFYSDVYDKESLASIANHSSRLRTLYITSNLKFCWTEPGLNNFSRPAPLLEYLYIHQSDMRAPLAVELPRLFDNHTPRLRQLVLRGNFSWKNNHFTTLTHLTLHGPEYVSFAANWEWFLELLAFLRMNPGLQEFNFSSVKRWLHRDHISQIQEGNQLPIELPCLQRLSMTSCTPPQASVLLSCLNLPPGASMRFNLDSTHSQAGTTVFNFLPADTSELGNLKQITALTIHEIPLIGIAKVIGTGASSGLYFRLCVDGPKSSNHIRSSALHERSIKALALLPIAAQLQKLWLTRDLDMSLGEESDEQDPSSKGLMDTPSWTYKLLFTHTTALKKLFLSGDRAKNVLMALRPVLSPDGTFVPSPRLETLVLDEHPNLPRELLLSVVRQRAEAGYPIRQLFITWDLELDEPDDWQYIEDLEGHVQAVYYDLYVMPRMKIPLKWGADRHDYWPYWSVVDFEY